MNSFAAVCTKDSFIRRINPCIKFLIYIIFVAILFIPTSLVLQIIFCLFVFCLFFIARISPRIFWRTFASVLIIFAFFLLINWFTYRGPGYFVTGEGHDVRQLGNYYGNNLGNAFSMHVRVEKTDLGYLCWVNGTKYNHPGDFIRNYLVGKDGHPISSSKPADIDKLLKPFLGKDYYFGALWGVPKEPWFRFEMALDSKTGNYFVSPACYVTAYALSWRSIVISIFVFFKIFTLIVLSTILTSTMTSVELTHALEDLLIPLKIFRFPVNEFAMILSITIRYIPTLLVEANRIMNAQSARGVDFKNGKFKDKINSITSLVIPMFSVAFRRADELSFAMEARGYNPRYLRSRYRSFPMRLSDLIIFSVVIALLCFFVIFNIKRVWIAPFDSFDWLVMFAQNCVILK